MTQQDNTAYLVALLASILLHAAGYGGAQWLRSSGLAERFFGAISFPTKSAAPQQRTITFVEIDEPQPQKARTFMETDDRQVTGETPAEAQYFSDRATVAANPENPTNVEGDTPYLDGRESPVPSTEDVPFNPPAAVPAPPARALVGTAPSATQPSAQTSPAPAEQTGQSPAEGLKVVEERKLAMLSKDSTPRHEPLVIESGQSSPSPQAAPAAVTSVREIAALKSRQTVAGISRSGVVAFNVAQDAFGPYMKEMVRAIQSRWYALIEQYKLYERSGHVVVVFDLHGDGRIENLRTEENTAGMVFGLFCEKAIIESSPFQPMPENLQFLVGNRGREIGFAFYWQ